MTKEPTDIYAYVTQEEAAYGQGIRVTGNWEWGMKEHVETTVLYKHSQLTGDKKKGTADEKPVKNIIRPILNLQYRAEGFDVKDIQLYVDDPDKYHLSFLIQKYHEKWARENGIDTFIDQLVECFVDFGGVLVKDGKDKPEVVPLPSMAFCDQTDLLSGPFALKHQFSPDQLLDMAALGWGNEASGATATLQEVIALSQDEKATDKPEGKKNATPGRYIEVYEVHGTLPARYLSDDPDVTGGETFIPQLQIICFYRGTGDKKTGITLFKGKEKKQPFKNKSRDEIYGRALGFGGAEELFEPQIWTNLSMIRKKEMLDAASKIAHVTDDPTFASNNNTRHIDNGAILQKAPGSSVEQLNTIPVNMKYFDAAVDEWETHAQQMGAANDAILGDSPASGTPFKLQELVTQEAHGLHDYRKGQLAVFVEEIYRDWVLPRLIRDMLKGQEFLADLSLDELQSVADSVVENAANDQIKAQMLKGVLPSQDAIDLLKQTMRDQFMKGGNKRFLKILQGELKDLPMAVTIDIAGKQKDLSAMVDKLSNIMRFAFSTYNPQTGTFAALDDPRMAKLLNQIFEYSGLSPIDFSPPVAPQQQAPTPQQPAPSLPSPVQQQPALAARQ